MSKEHIEIIDKIKGGQKSGLEILYTQYGRKFYSFAVRNWGLSEDDAWEVVYKTLYTLVIKLPEYSFESKKHFDNFLFKVYINFLRQFYRDHRKLQIEKIGIDNLFGVGINEEGEDIDIEPRIFSDYYRAETPENPKLIALKNALQQLDEEERDILLLRAQDYSYDEIASMLKIENNQLKVRHHRIKARLLKILNKNTSHNEQQQNHKLPERSP